MSDEVIITSGDAIQVRVRGEDEQAIINYSEDIVVKVRHNQQVSVELTQQGPQGPQGEKGDVGDISPQLEQLRTDTIAAKNTAVASKDAAATSETNAKASETAAKTSETNAKTSETNAKASETAAKTSEINADASETAADTSAANAATSEANALAYRNAASGHSATAATKAGEASASATTATNKADEAATKASEASNSAQIATSAEIAATTAATEALASQTAASGSASVANDAKAAAETARSGAEAAQIAAETAGTAAGNAKIDAEAARTLAQTAEGNSANAKVAAESARDLAIAARDTAVAARTGAETARDAAEDWADAAAASAAAAAQFDPSHYPTKENNGSDFSDPAAVRQNIGAQVALQTVDQAEAETGVGTIDRNWTSQRVRQAVASYAPAKVHGHAVADIDGLEAALNGKAAVASPEFTGTPTVPTAAAGNRSQQVANTEYVRNALDELVGASPGTLDTLQEIADALGDDPNFAATITQQLAGKSDIGHTHVAADITDLQALLDAKASLASPAFTGAPTAPTLPANDNTTGLATTEHVKLAIANSGLATDDHLHEIADVTGLQAALDGKAVTGHQHVAADITDLAVLLAAKADTGHGHGIAEIAGLQTALDGKANSGHGHAVADIAGLQTTLDGKSNTGHGHAVADITGLQATLDSKAAAGHGHAIADITDLQASLDAKFAKVGGTVTGALSVKGAGGGVSLITSDTTHTGYIELKRADGTRAAYMGYKLDGANPIHMIAEGDTTGFDFNKPVLVNNLPVAMQSAVDLKAPLASPTFTGNVTLPGTSTNRFSAGSGDGADYTTHNFRLRGHWGLGMETYDGSIQGYYDFRAGKWDTKGGFFKNGVEALYNNGGALTLGAANGNGVRFWNGNASYSISMSSVADATFGSRLDSSSDYNMCFRMSGGTNRGFVFKNDTTPVAQIEGSGNIRLTGDLVSAGSVYAGTNVIINSGGNSHVWHRVNGVNRGLTYYESSDGSMRWNLYNSSGTFVRNVDFRQTDGRFYVGGWIETASDISAGGKIYTRAVNNSVAKDNGEGNLEIRNASGATGDSGVAAIAFHCQGTYGIKLHLRADGYFGLGGWSSNAWRWYSAANGDMVAAGNVAAYSDPRLKEDVEVIDNALDIVESLRGVRFTWNGKTTLIGKPGERDIGVLADEVEAVLPEIVGRSIADEQNDGIQWRTVAYDKLTPVLIQAIKELRAEVAELRARAA